MRTNFRQLAKRIPNKVQIGPRLYYTVSFVDKININSKDVVIGMCDKNLKTIEILRTLGPKEKVMTYLHECIHAFSDENDIGITERQVGLLEKKCLLFMIKSGNIFI